VSFKRLHRAESTTTLNLLCWLDRMLVSGRFRVTDEVDYFRMAAGPEVL
jgi:hypothetical protein